VRPSSKALWWGLWIGSLVPAAIALVLLLPEWAARLAAVLIRPARKCWKRAHGWQAGFAGFPVKNPGKPNRRRP